MKWLLIIAILFGAPYAARAAEESLGTKIKKTFEPSPTPTRKHRKKKPTPTPSPEEFAETKKASPSPSPTATPKSKSKRKKNNSDPNATNRRRNRKSIRESGTNACSKEKGLAQREPFSALKYPDTKLIRQKYAKSSMPGSR